MEQKLLQAIFFTAFLIPIVCFYLLKWTVKGIIFMYFAFKDLLSDA